MAGRAGAPRQTGGPTGGEIRALPDELRRPTCAWAGRTGGRKLGGEGEAMETSGAAHHGGQQRLLGMLHVTCMDIIYRPKTSYTGHNVP